MKHTLLIFLLLISQAAGAQLCGLVVSVHDGDSFHLLAGGRKYKVRVQGIDCPEIGQPGGTAARDFAAQLLRNRQVCLTDTSRDKYGRLLGFVALPNGGLLQEELLANGWAWHYTKYDTSAHFAELAAKAAARRLGIWQQHQPTPPWVWRHRND